MALGTGTNIGPYRIESMIGAGGMGEVYLGRDTRLDRDVAIKVLPADKVADSDRKQRLLREAKSISALQHPNIVTIHGVETVAESLCVVMEYVRGKTLEELIPRHGLPVNQALRYAIQIAEALVAAHRSGILHRDLKPANIIVSEQGLVKLLDFGIAKAVEKEPPSGDTTATVITGDHATITGTAAYMSPEQAQGKKLDSRSDIFSFGAVLYEMVTGRRAFQGDSSISTLAAVMEREPKPLRELCPDVPVELERIIRRCLRKDPEKRWHHVSDVKVALEELREESESGQAAAIAPRRGISTWVIWAIAGLSALAVLGGGIWWSRPHRAALPPMKTVRVTSYPGVESFPSFSPDGTQIAFSWNGEKRDDFDIYVQLVAGGTPVRLTSDPAREFSSRWSPDGRYIAFQRVEGSGFGGIHLISPLGGNVRKLARTRLTNLDWLPDGETLVISDAPTAEEPLALSLLSTSTGATRIITSPPRGAFGDVHPAVSPDGTKIAFARWLTPGDCGVFVVPSHGGQARLLIQGQGTIRGIAWTPDGGQLIFSSYSSGYKLWRIPSDTASSTAEPVPTEGEAMRLVITRTRQGTTQLAYVQSNEDANLWLYDTASRQLRKIASSTRQDIHPQISADGTRVVFSSDRTGAHEIWTAKIDGTDAFQVTREGKDFRWPAWSPDGNRLAFELTLGPRQIYTVKTDGTDLRRISNSGLDHLWPAWSWDGKSIFFTSRPSPWEVRKLPASGGPEETVLAQGANKPTPSRDGKWLYTSPESHRGLQRTPMEGGSTELVLPQARFGAWALAEKGIYYVDIVPGTRNYRLNFYDLRTRKIKPEITFDGEWPSSRANLSASWDGRYVVWSMSERNESDIVMIQNFR